MGLTMGGMHGGDDGKEAPQRAGASHHCRPGQGGGCERAMMRPVMRPGTLAPSGVPHTTFLHPSTPVIPIALRQHLEVDVWEHLKKATRTGDKATTRCEVLQQGGCITMSVSPCAVGGLYHIFIMQRRMM